jgi:CRP-like cAMP-binding protein
VPIADKVPPRSFRSGVSLPATDAENLQNTILLSLPPKEREYVLARCELVNLPKHVVLYEAGDPIEIVYFIDTGLVSFLTVMADGKSVEVGLVGREGFVGVPLVFGFPSNPTRAVMQVEGNCYRITATNFRDALRECPTLERSLQRFSQSMALQATQIAACNRLHEVDRRLARWLLMSNDRLGENIVPLTQETLAHMLGTRRASVTVAAGILQKSGLITYRRGDVKIDNRPGLEAASCECYEAIKRQSQKWLNELRAK